MLAKDGVRKGMLFHVSISKTLPTTMEEFLKKVKKYINYENVLEAGKVLQVDLRMGNDLLITFYIA